MAKGKPNPGTKKDRRLRENKSVSPRKTQTMKKGRSKR